MAADPIAPNNKKAGTRPAFSLFRLVQRSSVLRNDRATPTIVDADGDDIDILTDALALVGQHGVYCRSARQPQYPAMDVRLVMQQIEDSKGLIIAAMEELKKKK